MDSHESKSQVFFVKINDIVFPGNEVVPNEEMINICNTEEANARLARH